MGSTIDWVDVVFSGIMICIIGVAMWHRLGSGLMGLNTDNRRGAFYEKPLKTRLILLGMVFLVGILYGIVRVFIPEANS